MKKETFVQTRFSATDDAARKIPKEFSNGTDNICPVRLLKTTYLFKTFPIRKEEVITDLHTNFAAAKDAMIARRKDNRECGEDKKTRVVFGAVMAWAYMGMLARMPGEEKARLSPNDIEAMTTAAIEAKGDFHNVYSHAAFNAAHYAVLQLSN